MLQSSDVLVFDGDYFEVASDNEGIAVSFVCALPMIFASCGTSSGAAPALLAFKFEDEEAEFLRSWHTLRCVTGSKQPPIKLDHNLPDWKPDIVVKITYIIVPRNVCSPDYSGGVLWSSLSGSKLPLERSHIFASILEDAKRISCWEDINVLNQLRSRSNLPPLPVELHSFEDGSQHQLAGCSHVSHGSSLQAAVLAEKCSGIASSQSASLRGALAPDESAILQVFHAQEDKLTPLCKQYVSLGTLATLATAAFNHPFIQLKRQVVAWGGYHIVACELAAQAALFMPNFPQILPWFYFHAERTKNVGSRVERQEGLLKGVHCCGLHCIEQQ
jgi:hypothetical protein